MTDKNVYQRFSDACRIIGSQQWVVNLENRQFKSIPIDAMRKGVRMACVEAGLVHVGPYDLEVTEALVDGRTHRFFGSCKFKYVNADNPSEEIVFESVGEAMDNGDKGTGKFLTNCIKNHYKAAFDIGEQGKDDIDSYSNEDIFEEAERIQEKRERKSRTEEDNGFAKAKACKTAINEWIDEDPIVNVSNEIIASYVGQYKSMDNWKPGTCIQCYKELRDAKVKGLKEVEL